MNCEMIKPLVSEYVDGRLNADRSRQVQAHLDHCPDCARFAHDLRALSGLLRGLPSAGMSSDFDAALARRLAQTPQPSPLQAWLRRFLDALRPAPILRPALALGAAMMVMAGIAVHQQSYREVIPPPPALTPVVERPLVTQCVEQHRRDMAAQPLSDIAAQNLAEQLDGAGASTTDTTTDEGSL